MEEEVSAAPLAAPVAHTIPAASNADLVHGHASNALLTLALQSPNLESPNPSLVGPSIGQDLPVERGILFPAETAVQSIVDQIIRGRERTSLISKEAIVDKMGLSYVRHLCV